LLANQNRVHLVPIRTALFKHAALPAKLIINLWLMAFHLIAANKNEVLVHVDYVDVITMPAVLSTLLYAVVAVWE
jgi:hypothetical protein